MAFYQVPSVMMPNMTVMMLRKARWKQTSESGVATLIFSSLVFRK